MDSINNTTDEIAICKKKISAIAKSSGIPYHVGDSADIEQLRAILVLAETGMPFVLINVPTWIQNNYLVFKSVLPVQADYVDGKLTFHGHWPKGNYVYKNCGEIEHIDMKVAINVRPNTKRKWVDCGDTGEFFGYGDYINKEYTGSHAADVPAYVIYGIRLPRGKKYVHPNSPCTNIKK